MTTIEKIRAQYPQYNDIADEQLLRGVHAKHYSDMNYDEFYTKAVGVLQPQSSAVGAGYRGIEQGLTGSFADEAKAGIGAGYAKLFGGDATSGESYGDLYSEALQGLNQELGRDIQQQPTATIGGNVVGGLLGAGKLASTGAGAALGNSLRSGGLAARMGKGALLGAASGGVYGAGGAQEGQRMQGAQEGAIMGATVGGAIPAVGAGLSRLNTKNVIPSAQQIRAKASELYKVADKTGGVLKPSFTNKFIDKAKQSLLSDDSLINEMKSNKPLRDAFDDIEMFRNQPLSLQRAQALDEQIGNMIDGFKDATTGKLTKQGAKLFEMQSQFRSAIESADAAAITGGRAGFDALKEGRKLWATSRRMADIERIIDNADSFQVPATAIKTGFRQLLRNPKRLAGYTPAEVAAIRKASKTGVVTDLLNVAGSRLMPIVAVGGGAAAGGPAGAVGGFAASQVASSLSRKGAESLQRGRGNRALSEIAKRSGMATQTQRVDPAILREIMSLPPQEAQEILKQIGLQSAAQSMEQ